MNFNQSLYDELCILRQRIKEREKRSYGRTPLVCTDEALYKIAELCPKKLADFDCVSGIGKSFVDNYGNEFISVILKHCDAKEQNSLNITSSVTETLKELEKKLVSINRRNRLLYMPKCSSRYAFDMFDVGADKLNGLLFGKLRSLTLADINNLSGIEAAEENAKFKKIAQLLREVNIDLRDKGQNDLYIGYPFVIGRMPGEEFDVRAPLVLFPVSAEKTATTIKLSLDQTRDVIFNNTFVLGFFKFNNITKPLPSEVVENVTEDTFYDDVLKFYRENEINIKNKGTGLLEYKEYKADEFPKFNSGEMYLESCAVLGKFPICSNSIQKDFEEILKNNQINNLLNDLLASDNEIDSIDDDYKLEENNICNETSDLLEKNIVYINELNSSQEAVLSETNNSRELVVQGPPGTGKSQVITNLIAKFVHDGKNVLMVSEKKTALDVVYSRLGNLSQYALMIDNVGNKEGFYSQLSKMVNLNQTFFDAAEIDPVSQKIETLIEKLGVVAELLYQPCEFGIEPYKLYLKNKKYDLSDNDVREYVLKLTALRKAELLQLKYDELENIHSLFLDCKLCENLEKYVFINEKYPFMQYIRKDLSEYDTLVFKNELTTLKDNKDVWMSKNAVLRLLSKHRITQEAESILNKYFYFFSKKGSEYLLNNINAVIGSIDHYIEYQQISGLYGQLSQSERDYFSSLLKVKKATSCDQSNANDQLFNLLLFEHISVFESKNRALLQDIDDFDLIIQNISELIKSKQKITRERLTASLSKDMRILSSSKRHGEILRAIESKRKMSVNKFIKKFEFELLNGVKIWLLTPEVVSEIIPLQTGIFDLVVFDEASQMYVEKGVPSILRAKKVVVAGDHKQLRPSSLGAGRLEIDIDDMPEDAELSAALEEESLLDLARFRYKDVMLNFHYRSCYEELIAFSNHAFYGGRLHVSPNTAAQTEPPIKVHKLDDAMWVNRANINEAKYVVDMLKRFFAERQENETVGIITFNINQRDLIDDLIDEECVKDPEFAAQVRAELIRKNNGEDIGLFVKNIESVQGDERDVIIFSVGYAKNESGKFIRNFGWLNQKGGENRLNVAISRAKKKVHIVTSFEPSELKVDDTKNDGPKILKKYLEYAFAVSGGDTAAAKQILQSFGNECLCDGTSSFDDDFQNQVYAALQKEGYELERQVGIGGYYIDLAVKKDGKYILGIECDGKKYNDSSLPREKYYHRQKYFESRGWKIHRIWSADWWKNPQKEIQKIKSIID